VDAVKTVQVRTADPRDRHRATIRLMSLDRFPGMPIPGELVNLQMPGTTQTIPGVVAYLHTGDGVVGVEPDFQTIVATRTSEERHHLDR
jgi:hypothetical protein